MHISLTFTVLSFAIAASLPAKALVTGAPQLSVQESPKSQDSLSDLTEENAVLEFAARVARGQFGPADPETAARLVEPLARNGDARAEYYLGEAYLSGFGVERKQELGALWIIKSADRGYANAEAEAAFLYARGIGVPKNPALAFSVAKKAANSGSTQGLVALGKMYLDGVGTRSDVNEARKLFFIAANRRDASAMIALGDLYWDGRGATQDYVTAETWYNVAIANATAWSRIAAIAARDQTAALLLPSDAAVARRLAADWKPGDDIVARRSKLLSAPAPAEDKLSSTVTPGVSSATRFLGKTLSRTDMPIIVKKFVSEGDISSDRTAVWTTHSEILVNKESGIRLAGEHPLPYSDKLSTLDIVEAYTLSPTGKRLPVNVSAIYPQLRPGAPNTPMFDDQKQKVVVFPSVEVGSTVVLTTRLTAKPVLAGYFGATRVFEPTVAYYDAMVRIRTPEAMPLKTETHDLRFAERLEGGHHVYEWRYSNTAPLAEAIIAIDPHDRWPRFAASNFHSYDQFAHTYAALVVSKVSVTPKIRELADKITTGTTDRRKQAELIYDWVSRRIRYVAIEFGKSAIIPHDADGVLSAGYGDCKDHSALFAALLKAKGIRSYIALINEGVSYELPEAPTIATLNHAIIWLPDFDLFADTTAGIAPFGILPMLEYGKPVVIAVGAGPTLRRTPMIPSSNNTVSTTTKAVLMPDGRVTGDSETTSSGPFSVNLRATAVRIESSGPAQTATWLLRSRSLDGNGEFHITSPFDLSPTYTVKGHFETAVRADYVAGGSFRLPEGLGLGTPPGDLLVGSINFKDFGGFEPTSCFPGRENEEVSLELPAGKKVRELPKGTEIKNQFLAYRSSWSIAGRTVTLRRSFESFVSQPLCVGAVRREAAAVLNNIRRDYWLATIALVNE